jgi:hypothetical protein
VVYIFIVDIQRRMGEDGGVKKPRKKAAGGMKKTEAPPAGGARISVNPPAAGESVQSLGNQGPSSFVRPCQTIFYKKKYETDADEF